MVATPAKFGKTRYDVIIVGGGPAGLFAAFYLCENARFKVLIVEKGKGPLKRKCPINKNMKCVKCRPCDILSGVGGAGLFSDGKLNFIHKLGKRDSDQSKKVLFKQHYSGSRACGRGLDWKACVEIWDRTQSKRD
jgi:hypothetical protein